MQNELRECNVIVLPMELLDDRKKNSDTPVRNCCTLKVKKDCLLYRNFPAIFRNFPQFFHNFSQLDLTPQDRNPPPLFLLAGGVEKNSRAP